MRLRVVVPATVVLVVLSPVASACGSADDASSSAATAVEASPDPSPSASTTLPPPVTSPSTETPPSAQGSTTPAPAVEPPPAPAAGAYISVYDYEADPAAFAGSDVVLFFHADWCPKCRKAEAQFESDGVPSGLTIVKASFDNDTDLRKKYGVTLQHTYVHVDANGDQLAKWTGGYDSDDLAEIQANVA